MRHGIEILQNQPVKYHTIRPPDLLTVRGSGAATEITINYVVITDTNDRNCSIFVPSAMPSPDGWSSKELT